MGKKTARLVAAETLMQVNRHGGFSNVVLNSAIKREELSAQDVAFTSVLLYGVLERKLTLDHVIRHYSGRPLKSLSPAVVEILRLSLYQLLFLDRVPEAAAVDEGVTLTKKMKVASASGFVNAVLRSFLRDGKKIPPVKGNRLKKLEVKYSCPQWLIMRLMENYGEENTLALLEHSIGRPELYARVNTTKITANALVEKLILEGALAQLDSGLSDCILLSSTASVEAMPSFKEGLFHIQDKSSQLCAAAMGAKPGERVLDLCSAPGSKAFTMAERMEGKGKLAACDILPEKVEKIRQGAARLGLGVIVPFLNDATVYHSELTTFDRVLCDAPCSGLGIIGRKPEIKYKDEKELRGLPEIQAKILRVAAAYVKPGGTLVYSTCTLLPEENQEIARQFLKETPEFEPLPLCEEVRASLALAEGTWDCTLFPQMAKTDGFYMASMKRKTV